MAIFKLALLLFKGVRREVRLDREIVAHGFSDDTRIVREFRRLYCRKRVLRL